MPVYLETKDRFLGELVVSPSNVVIAKPHSELHCYNEFLGVVTTIEVSSATASLMLYMATEPAENFLTELLELNDALADGRPLKACYVPSKLREPSPA